MVARTSQLNMQPSSIDFVDMVSIHDVNYENGIFSITGKLSHPAVTPDTAYTVLTDYDALPDIFHNVHESSVRLTDSGQKFISQRCSWRFLVFGGSFLTELEVIEEAAARQLQFSLHKKSAFMRKFIGTWDVRLNPQGGSDIWHSMSVAPAIAPPKKIGELTKKIFVSQVEGILGDLAMELHRRSVDIESSDVEANPSSSSSR